MSYQTAVGKNRKSKKCVIGLYQGKGERIGAGNDPNAPVSAGYVLRARLATSKVMMSKNRRLTDDVVYPLPDSDLDLDKWHDIRRNTSLVRRAVNRLSNEARKLGFESVEVWDCSRRKAVLQSSRKLAPATAA